MKAYDLLAQTESGLCSVTGAAAAPGRVGVSVCDIGCGMYGYMAIIEALIARGISGEGCGIDTSLFAGMADWMTVPLFHWEADDKGPPRVGLKHPSIHPYGVYPARDGAPVLIAVQNEREFVRLCAEVLERSDLPRPAVREQPRPARKPRAVRCDPVRNVPRDRPNDADRTAEAGADRLTVRHEIFGPDGLATVEDHDTVYRGAAPAEAVWRREIRPDPVLLFRYSALTMNSHRIHYDRDYVTGVEGYPGLLVHGNLVATLLLDLFRRALPAVRLETFAVRALSPLYDTAPFTLAGAPGPEPGTAKLWAVSSAGRIARSAEVTFQGWRRARPDRAGPAPAA